MIHGVLLFLGVALFTGAVISTIAVWLMAAALIHPPRMGDGKAIYLLRRLSPADVGLPFESITFTVRDERQRPLKIASWWIPNPQANGRTAILLHGYADAKVGALAWAPMWHALGFNLLLPDLRAHGESSGDTCTGGDFERHDISQLIDQLKASRPNDTRQIFLFGASLGGAVALVVAALRGDIAGVVMDSPFASFASASAAHMQRLGLPGFVFQRPAIALAQRLSDANYSGVAPTRQLLNFTFSVMMVLPEKDVYVSDADRECFTEIMKTRSEKYADELWVVPDVAHLMPLVAFPTEYQERLANFCGREAQQQANRA